MANERPSQAYAQAVFEMALAGWLAPLKSIAAAVTRTDLAQRVDSAELAFSKKQELLSPVLPQQAPAELRNFLFLLANKNELHLLPAIVADLDRVSHASLAATVAKVTSAVPLTDSEKKAMEDRLRKQFGSDASFEYAVDPAILGGIVVRAGDKVIDGSVSGKLAALKEKLK